MKITQESIFSSSIRAFFKALFTLIGIGAGIIPIILLVGFAVNSGAPELPSRHSVKVHPNPDGSRRSFDLISPVILKIDITGVIGAGSLTSKKIDSILQESRDGVFKKDRVKAILLNINSPGGALLDTDQIYRSLMDYKQRYKVPVFAYVDGMAASGGVWIAAAADQIYASDVSLIGSVGVVLTPFFNISDTMEKLGIKSTTITAGKDKDLMNPTREWKVDESAVLQDITNYYYDMFVDLVTTARPQVDRKKLVGEYGARIFPAKEAQEYGFIDHSSARLKDALHALATTAGISGKDYQVVELDSSDWVFGLFREDSPLFSGKVQHEIQVSPQLNNVVTQPLLLSSGAQ